MSQTLELPPKLPVLLLADGVIFPSVTVRIPVRNRNNVNVVNYVVNDGRGLLAVAVKKTGHRQNDNELPMYEVGTAVRVTQVLSSNRPQQQQSYTLHVTGVCRIRYNTILRTQPFVLADVTQLDRQPGSLLLPENFTGKHRQFAEDVDILLRMLGRRSGAIHRLKSSIESLPLDVLVDSVAGTLSAIPDVDRMRLLQTVDVDQRMEILDEKVQAFLKDMENDVRPSGDATSDETSADDNGSLDQLYRIMDRLLVPDGNGVVRLNGGGPAGPNGGGRAAKQSDLEALKEKLKAAKMPSSVEAEVLQEWDKLSNMAAHSPEHGGLRNWLQYMAALPWAKQTVDTLNVEKARHDLDADHYGLGKVKRPILEFLAVRQLRPSHKGPILCLVGPPGTGKTSIAQSVASTLSRKFQRLAAESVYGVSLGGVSDESDMRGHRRTYVGAMPGRIVQALKQAQSNNPVILLDEIDKMVVGASGFHGDPRAALLEVLDPEQNANFVDHYVNHPFDLSRVLFIATANSTSTIPPALFDRMEVIDVNGYTTHEKLEIAKRHLLPKQLRENGLAADTFDITDGLMLQIVNSYTHEAGVRQLERKLAQLCRAIALKRAGSDDQEDLLTVDDEFIWSVLGRPTIEHESADRLARVGVAAGLAWTPAGGSDGSLVTKRSGGELMYVEAKMMSGGQGALTLTGQLGQVMQESATIALSWCRANAHRMHLSPSTYSAKQTDLHVHFPAGAVSKDGPSAGLAVLVCLTSLLSDRPARPDTAMTGEITLRGSLLPVGGVVAKVLAADRAGLGRVILPSRNQADVHELPDDVQERIEFVFCDSMEEAVCAAFDDLQIEDEITMTNAKL